MRCIKIFKGHKIKDHSGMFRIVCDPSSGSIELYLTEIIRSGSLMFVVCLVGVWQRNFEPVVCVRGTTGWGLVPWYSLSEAESTSGHMVPSGGTTEKNPSDTTGIRSRDPPISSAVP